jgi:RHS repeat-associated protein
LINATGSTPNNYLFAGEQYDSALGLYYNRARYYNNSTGRYWSMDTDEGDDRDPASLHKYLYTKDDPVDGYDPSGHDDISDTINAMAVLNFRVIVASVKSALFDDPKDLWLMPKEDYQRYGKKKGLFAGQAPDRSILYMVERRDGGRLHNNWTISEHQTNAALAGADGTSSHDGSRFCDELSPVTSEIQIESNQTFTVSPQPGKFNPANENDDIFVHTGNGDFGKLHIFMNWHAVTINGFDKWKGATDDVCQAY